MKKLIAVLLVLCLGCMMIPALAEGDSLVGTWYLTKAESQGVTMPVDGTGISMTLTLKEDGSFDLEESAFGQTQTASGTWAATVTGVALTVQGETLEAKVADDAIVLEVSGAVMYLTRTAPEARDIGEAGIKLAEDVTDFDGSWVISQAKVMGMTVSAEEAGMEELAVMKISNGSIVETAVDGTENKMEGVYADGKLAVTMNVEGVDVDMVFSLLEDGNLLASMTINYEGFSMDIELLYIPMADEAAEPAA